MTDSNLVLIAIADDHVMVRNSISAIISTFPGFSVIIEADNGKEMIQQIENAKTRPQICIIDISMPEMNGYDTLTEIKKRWSDMKVLALSMYNNEFSIIKMLRLGANGYLLKGADLKELNKALTDISIKGFYNSELVASNIFHVMHNEKEVSSYKINDKELQFLKLCCTELNYKEIGKKMGLSTRTVEGYRNSLFDKLNLNSRIGLAMFAIHTGIVPLEGISPTE